MFHGLRVGTRERYFCCMSILSIDSFTTLYIFTDFIMVHCILAIMGSDTVPILFTTL